MSKADPIVKDCIKTLSVIVNTSAGLAHPLDESRAKELFKALHQKGFALLENDIYQLAIANDWPTNHAKKLAQLAAKIGDGGRVVIKHPRNWGKTTVDRIIAEHQ